MLNITFYILSNFSFFSTTEESPLPTFKTTKLAHTSHRCCSGTCGAKRLPFFPEMEPANELDVLWVNATLAVLYYYC